MGDNLLRLPAAHSGGYWWSDKCFQCIVYYIRFHLYMTRGRRCGLVEIMGQSWSLFCIQDSLICW